MRGNLRRKAPYGALTLILLAVLGVSLAFSGGVSRWLGSVAWIAAATVTLAAVSAAAVRMREGRIGFAWRAWAVGTGFAFLGAIVHNVTLSTSGPSLAEVFWWLSALAFLSGQAFRAPPGDLSFRLYLLDAIPVVLAVAATVQIVAGQPLGERAGHDVTLLLNATLFPLVALVGLQMLALFPTRSVFLGAMCFCLVGAGSIIWSLQAFDSLGTFNWSALLWVLGLVALGWAGLERALVPQSPNRLVAPAKEAGSRAIPPAAAIVALVLMADTVGSEYEALLVGFATAALLAFGARFYLIRREYARSQQALGESERRFRSIFETAPIGIAVSSPEGRFVEVNDSLATMLGYEPLELVGRSVWELTHPDHARSNAQSYQELIDGVVDSYTVEKRYLRKDGDALWATARASLVRDELGRPQLGIGMIEDITRRRQADELLREAERKYRTLVEQLPLVTYIDAIDDRSSNVYTSPQIEALLGYTVEEWQSKPDLFTSILHPDDRDRVLAEIARTNRTGEPFVEEYRLLARDGRTVWFRDEAVIVRDDGGRPLHAQGYLLDITERKRAEDAIRESGNRFRTLIENIPGGVFRCTADEDWTITFMSDDIEEISGYPPSDFVGNAKRTFASIIHPHDRRKVERAVRAALETQTPFIVEYRILTAAGEERWVYEKGQPVFAAEGGDPWVDGVIFDITDRKQAEQEREQLLETLAGHNEQLRALDKMKDEFVALVSHELRTPLTSILGYLELVLEGEAGEVSEEQRHFLSVVERNSQRLLRLVGDLLFVAQIEAGKLALERETVDLAVIVGECIEAARPRASEQHIELRLEAAPVPLLSGDRVRLAQLLDNLVSNAIKFTPEGGCVAVSLSHGSGAVVLEVSDTGMGIPPAEQARLFERFFRTSGATRNAIQGTGLGLVITKAIAEAHGGRISVESQENVGTTFRVEFPFAMGAESVGEAA